MSDLGISFAALFYGSFVGLSLGLTGGGGAVVAIPLLIYGLGFQYSEAIAISLAVIGGTSLYGALLQSHKGHVLWLIGAILGIGGIPTVSIGKWISDHSSQNVLLFLFALLMTFIGLKMIFQHKLNRQPGSKVRIHHANVWKYLTWQRVVMLLFFGGIVGVLSGTFGIGGGFFFVPTLDFILKIPIEQATATSLVGIFLIAVSGVFLNLDLFNSEETVLALQFFIGSACGMTIGSFAKELVSGRTLEILFGSFVLALAAFVLYAQAH
jgi:hypothetical protein